jgi:hypothetical protein
VPVKEKTKKHRARLRAVTAARVRPYRTTDNKIDGAVITLVDLQGKKESYAGKTSNRAKEGSQQK